MLPGIDVSHFQSKIDWPKVAGSGIKFAYIKATQGASFLDPMAVTNCMEACAAGIPFGIYHVFMGDATIEKQLANWGRAVSLLKPDLPWWLDIEPGSVTDETAPQALAMLRAAFQPTDCVYCSPSTAQAYLSDPGFQAYQLAIAHYTDAPSPNTVLWPGWEFWQHSATGKVDGVPALVDLDWFNGDSEALQALISRPTNLTT